MTEIFATLLNMSIVASFMVLAVIILRLILKKSPKWIRCVMWGMVAVRLIIPFSFESKFSLIPNAQEVNSTSSTTTSYINSSVESYAPTQATTNPPDVLSILSIVWVVGVALMLAYLIFSYIRLSRMVVGSVRLKENIWLCDHISSPFVLGVFKPKIYLFSSMDESQNKYVIAHEQAHLKRFDNVWKPMGFLLLSIYWFNPLIWFAYWLFIKDIELACDESVVKTFNLNDKKAYSDALLSCSSTIKTALACPLAFGESNVKQRIKSVLSYKKPKFYVVVGTVLACIIAFVLFMTNPIGAIENEDTKPVEDNTIPTVAATQEVTETVPATTAQVTEKPTEKPTEATKEATEEVEEYVAEDNSDYNDYYDDSYSYENYSNEEREYSIIEPQEIPKIDPEKYAHVYDGYSSSNDDNFGLSVGQPNQGYANAWTGTDANNNDIYKWDSLVP